MVCKNRQLIGMVAVMWLSKSIKRLESHEDNAERPMTVSTVYLIKNNG